jgi:hypothetical protein
VYDLGEGFNAMPPGEVALLILLFVLSVLGIGYGVERRGRRKIEESKLERLREQGERNLRIVEEQAELRCTMCGKHVDPEQGDIYYKGTWWCLPHWKECTDDIRGNEDTWEHKR